MARRKLEIETLETTLRLFSRRLTDFKGESRRGYKKAFSSFQIYVASNYDLSTRLDSSVIGNWIIANLIQGLSVKTVTFYLDKLSGLYGNIAHKLESGKTSVFKDVKERLKEWESIHDSFSGLKNFGNKILPEWRKLIAKEEPNDILKALLKLKESPEESSDEKTETAWCCLALYSGEHADIVKGIFPSPPSNLSVLEICDTWKVSKSERAQIIKRVIEHLLSEEMRWFAMRLRPSVKFEDIIKRFTSATCLKMPQLFYPTEEIARKTGRKVIWEDKPIMRDIVFFKWQRSEIYPLFTHLFDLAWCYKTPGGGPGEYASIPDRAMEDFIAAMGILGPDFEITPAGKMKLKKGDEVVIVTGEYARQHARILKTDIADDDYHKIYRVTLLHQNGHWDIGIDARMLRKV